MRCRAVPDIAFCERFAAPAFRDAWRPGLTVNVYAAGCQGTARIARISRRPVYKIGVHAGPDVSVRIAGLSRIRYAAAYEQHGIMTVEPGYEGWAVEPFVLATTPVVATSPVRFCGCSLAVTLPVGMSPSAFDQKLAKSLATKSLHSFAWSAEGEAHCRRLGADAATMIRYTLDGTSRSACTELILIRPRNDTADLIRRIEDIVYCHVIGSATG